MTLAQSSAVTHRLDAMLEDVQRLLRCDAEDLAAIREELRGLAEEDWPAWVTAYENAPRRAQHRKELEAAQAASEVLTRTLSDGPLKVALWHYGSKHDLGILQLQREVKAVTAKLGSAIESALEDMGPKGGGDAVKVHSVTPKIMLAWVCLALFEHFRPGEATSTKEGDADQLLSVLYEIVSGESDRSLNKVLREELKRWHDYNQGAEEALRKYQNDPRPPPPKPGLFS